MKRFQKLLFLLTAFLIAIPVFAQTQVYIAQPPDWSITPNQAQLDFWVKNNPDFIEMTFLCTLELTGDGILGSMNTARFPKRGDLSETDETKWSFVELIERADKHLVYKVKYTGSSNENRFKAGDDWLMAEEFFIFKQWPTYGHFIVKANSIVIKDSDNRVVRSNPSTEYAIDFGPIPESKIYLSLNGQDRIEEKEKDLNVELRFRNPEDSLAGLQFNLQVPKNLKLENIELPQGKDWTAIYNRDRDNVYTIIMHFNNLEEAFAPYDRERLLANMIFSIEPGSLHAGDELILVIKNAVASDTKANPIKVEISNLWMIKVFRSREKGDVKYDYIVDFKDAFKTDKHIVGMISLEGEDFWAADMNDNGIINVFDIIMILRKAKLGYYIVKDVESKDNYVIAKKARSIIIAGSNLKSVEPNQDMINPEFKDGQYFAAEFNNEFTGNLIFNPDAKIDSGHQIGLVPSNVRESELNYDIISDIIVYPNPANSQSIVKYTIRYFGHVELAIYNLMGNLIKTLVSQEQAPGEYNVVFNTTNLASGQYFYELRIKTPESEEIISNPLIIK
ncbi:MAG: T9SS type A sorting domain-containing protein [bacterium]